MKKCIVEIIKDIKDLEEEKRRLLRYEDVECTSVFSKGEEPEPTDYQFEKIRQMLAELNGEIRRLRHILNKANYEIYVEEAGMTLGECIVYLSQLTYDRNQVSGMLTIPPMEKTLTTSGVVEYTKANFSREEADKTYRSLKAQVRKIQILIDRTNLTAEIEV